MEQKAITLDDYLYKQAKIITALVTRNSHF